MTLKSEWSNARRIVIILVGVLLYNSSIILGFVVKLGRETPSSNFATYEKSAVYTSVFFIFSNLLLDAYIPYNRKISDIIFVMVTDQALMTLTIMTVALVGCWFTFPRSASGYLLIVGVTVLSFQRILACYLYSKAGNERKAVLPDKEN